MGAGVNAGAMCGRGVMKVERHSEVLTMKRSEFEPMMQSLESRQMLSVTLLEGVLSVEGTDGDDVVTFSVDSTVPETPALVVSLNGVSTSNPLASVTSIKVNAGGGDDSVTFGDVAIAGTVDGGAGK